MAAAARLFGFRGDAAAALVVLALLPVAQTAFVICEQAGGAGAHTVTAAMALSLLAMLPQLVVVLALFERLGAF
jgi:predicted permease